MPNSTTRAVFRVGPSCRLHYNDGVHLIPEQELAEPAVQHHHLSLLHHHVA